MRWKPWLIACVSLSLFACATASGPLLTATLVVGGGKSKRVLELTGRDYQVTVSQVGLDGIPSMRTRKGTLDRQEYERLRQRISAVDLAALKELYTGRDATILRTIVTLRVTLGGVTKALTVVGSPPEEAQALLDPLLPLLDRGL